MNSNIFVFRHTWAGTASIDNRGLWHGPYSHGMEALQGHFILTPLIPVKTCLPFITVTMRSNDFL